MADRPLCFVLMPFGKKSGPSGEEIDFDAVYRQVIAPAVEAAGMEPLRADEEKVGGIIHKPMFERLILCDYAVADLTLANANVFYELGIRHAVRPFSTVLLFAEGQRLPFDVAPLRACPYRLSGGAPADPTDTAGRIEALLVEARKQGVDSPVFQLVEDFRPPEIAHLKTDVFRDRAEYSQQAKERLARARDEGPEAVARMREELEPLADREAGVLVDLLLSHRAVKDWEGMAALVEKLPEPVRRTVLVQEQYAFALNRAGRDREAERVLRRVLEEHGPSSETWGLLGRVYKDRWDAARKTGDVTAPAHLRQAADAYREGFETDWRDAYPGINAATLMELMDPPPPEQADLLPVVVYSARRRVENRGGDYWDWATLLEARVLARDRDGARNALGEALTRVREPWEPETTANNLRMIRRARADRGEDVGWIEELEQPLLQAGR